MGQDTQRRGALVGREGRRRGARRLAPASSARAHDMNVRLSTRATSDGGERAIQQPAHLPPLPSPARTTAPDSASVDSSFSRSAAVPSHRCTRAGASALTERSTNSRSAALVVHSASGGEPALSVYARRAAPPSSAALRGAARHAPPNARTPAAEPEHGRRISAREEENMKPDVGRNKEVADTRSRMKPGEQKTQGMDICTGMCNTRFSAKFSLVSGAGGGFPQRCSARNTLLHTSHR
jgi:hypothetical protein